MLTDRKYYRFRDYVCIECSRAGGKRCEITLYKSGLLVAHNCGMLKEHFSYEVQYILHQYIKNADSLFGSSSLEDLLDLGL